MLKELRNRFLLINMICICFLVIAAFFAIFLIVNNSVNTDIQKRLDRALMMQPIRSPDKPQEGLPFPSNKDKGLQPRHNFDDSRSFSVEINSSGEIMTHTSFLGENNEVYASIAQEALKLTGDSGSLKAEDAYWRYEIRRRADESRTIALVDITSERSIIINLVLSLALATVVLIIIIFFICLYFANKSIEPVKVAWEKQKQFIADASHELKTPLSTINTNLDVVTSHPESTISQESKWLGYIRSETERMTKLVNDLLSLARVEHDEKVQIYETISFSYIAESMILAMEAVTYEKNINLTYDIEPEIIVRGDERQLSQIVMILLDNAVKYTPDGGKINITLSGSGQKSALLRVENTGSYIPENELESIFDRFYRVDKSRSGEGGYGLGLAIAKSIAYRHGGRIKAEIVKGGICFTVSIPLVKN